MEKRVVLLKADGTREDLRPEKKPTLEQMQAWVGGYIEVRHFKFEGHAAVLVMNEEGRLYGLPHNGLATRAFGFPIVGDAFVLIGWRL